MAARDRTVLPRQSVNRFCPLMLQGRGGHAPGEMSAPRLRAPESELAPIAARQAPHGPASICDPRPERPCISRKNRARPCPARRGNQLEFFLGGKRDCFLA